MLTRRLVKEVVVARLARRVTPFWFFFSLLLGVVVFIEERTCAETPVFRFVGCRSCQKSEISTSLKWEIIPLLGRRTLQTGTISGH